MREIHEDTAEALAGETLAPVGLVELEFESGTMRLWDGIGTLTWNGNVFSGVGTLGQIGPVEETTENRAVGVALSLSGIPAEVLTIAHGEGWQQRAARIYYGVLDGRSFVGEPIQVFAGLMDQMVLTEGEQAQIKLTLESDQIDLERTKARRYTAEDQRSEYAGDAGYDQVPSLQDAVIKLPT